MSAVQLPERCSREIKWPREKTPGMSWNTGAVYPGTGDAFVDDSPGQEEHAEATQKKEKDAAESVREQRGHSCASSDERDSHKLPKEERYLGGDGSTAGAWERRSKGRARIGTWSVVLLSVSAHRWQRQTRTLQRHPRFIFFLFPSFLSPDSLSSLTTTSTTATLVYTIAWQSA